MKKKEKSLLVKLREVPVVETRCCYQSLVSSCLGIVSLSSLEKISKVRCQEIIRNKI